MALSQTLEKLQKIDNDERKFYIFQKLYETERLDLIPCDKILYAIGSILFSTMDLNLLRTILNEIIQEYSKKYKIPKNHFSLFIRELLRINMNTFDLLCETIANKIFIIAFKKIPVDKILTLRQYV